MMTEREKKLVAHALRIEKIVYEREKELENFFGGHVYLLGDNDTWGSLQEALGIPEDTNDEFGETVYDYVSGEISLELTLAKINEVIKRG
jgi:hypothetical protein